MTPFISDRGPPCIQPGFFHCSIGMAIAEGAGGVKPGTLKLRANAHEKTDTLPKKGLFQLPTINFQG